MGQRIAMGVAENLLTSGRMLFWKVGVNGPVRRIAIIGGGPAGATAAERLARGAAAAGERVAVTVFEERIGWEKPCGGGLPWKALRRYPFLLEASEPHRCAHDAELVAPNGRTLRVQLRAPLAIYSRSTLNNLLLRRAENAGAEIVPERILSFRRTNSGWRLEGRTGNYHAQYVILAGGARTALRRLLAADFGPRDYMLTFGYYVPAADYLLRVQFFEDFEGYAWAFPRSDHFSVGICGRAGRVSMPELRGRLHDFLQRFGYAHEAAPVYSHLLPSLTAASWSGLRLAGRGWALVGDAAGLVDPLTGEGIYYAMRSGDLLAESLLDDLPELYPERVRQEFAAQLAMAARLAPHFFRGRILGETLITRLVEFASCSKTLMDSLQDLMAGLQSYPALALRLYRGLANASAVMLIGSLRDSLGPPHLASRT